MGSQVINSNYGWGYGGFGTGTWGSAPVYNQPLGYYLALVTHQYQNSPKFLQWLSVVLGIFNDIQMCLATFEESFEIPTAVGAQLDLIGQIVGVSRTVNFQPSAGVSPILDDNTYKILLQAQIAQNHWDGTVGSLQGIWQTLFPGGRIIIDDHQDMTATIILSGAFSSITQDLITNGYIVPRPQAVLYNYVFSTLPIFGTDFDNAFIAGLDTGHLA